MYAYVAPSQANEPSGLGEPEPAVMLLETASCTLSRARSEFTVEPTGSVQVIVSGTVTRSLACSVAVAPTFTVMVPNPFVEAVRAAERWQIPPRPDVSVLDGVMGELGVPKDESGGGVEPRQGRIGEQREGVMIPALRSLHEILLAHIHPSAGASVGRAAWWASCRAEWFPIRSRCECAASKDPSTRHPQNTWSSD